MRLFKTDGAENVDWYGWHVEVHAPFDGVVTEVGISHTTNKPGTEGKPPPGYIKFQRADGVIVVYVHLDDIRVRLGNPVSTGQVVAVDGNNGFARMPHVHVGAYLAQNAPADPLGPRSGRPNSNLVGQVGLRRPHAQCYA